MKTHIVRSQQTDRYRLKVPESLADMTAAQGSAETAVESYSSGASPNLSFDTFNLTGIADSGSGGIQILTGGLYLLVITFTWVFASAGAPSIARSVGYSLNGGSFAAQLDFNNDATGTTRWDDQGTWLVRLAVGDVIRPHVFSDPGFGWNVSAKIQIAQLSS